REPKVTTADVLEALHHATGMPIIADFYTRLYKPDAVSLENRPLFDILNQLCDTMGLRWNKDAGGGTAGTHEVGGRSGEQERSDAGYPRSGWTWLQFRSITYYHDRLKE